MILEEEIDVRLKKPFATWTEDDKRISAGVCFATDKPQDRNVAAWLDEEFILEHNNVKIVVLLEAREYLNTLDLDLVPVSPSSPCLFTTAQQQAFYAKVPRTYHEAHRLLGLGCDATWRDFMIATDDAVSPERSRNE